MKAQELRIGNYVTDRGGKIIKIDFFEYLEIGFDCKFGEKQFFDSEEMHPLTEYTDHAKPIPLTEEWLVKFGFTKRQTSNNCNKWFKGENPVTHDWLFSLVWLVGHPTPFYQNGYHMIKYVHQLQNLYYALTGEELCTQ